ncbi:hypothetical protein TRVL_04989 [Trypanosoma vivax]|uniref:SUI1 domain-containing protein n=1 Tax=Trypanosoma vivax (strain Y486) TaxID=1055687 RepID=G0TY82_TRYVY|nr:hypothetical protein TRVL_04989 [Trypanosoma vivax]CCC48927.1 conserved hypothetical protein [Trypanosoma vivax Y486]
MFHKKYSVKDVTTVSAKEAKALREKVLSSVGKEQLSFAESIWKKGEPISRSIWQLSSGGSASIYFLKKIPLAFSTLCLPNDAKESLCISSDLVFPTLFFILMMRDANNGKDIDFTSIFRNNVFCRGPTSQFIVSGAHLMIPGIVNVSTLDQENILKGDAVYIYSTGNRIPFAIGLATEELSRNAERGRGVYILHSYKDNLWEEYFKPFVSACACPKSILPDTFQEASVNDCLSSPTPRMTMLEEIHFANDSTLSVPPEEQNSIFLEKVVKSAFDTLSNEEKLLDFALCETLRNFKTSSLPIPVGEFIPLLLGNFPRFPDIEMRIDFKKTKYKKALSYLSTRDDTLKISMEGKGCYFVVEVMKSSDLYRNHRHEYADFLRFIQDPMKDQEVIESKRLLNCGVGKGILKSRIKSMESLYAPKTKCMLDLQRVVCTGLFPATDNISGSLMSEENDSGGQQVAYNVGNDFLGDVYSRKYLCNNLRKYISSKNLLRFNSGKNSPPDVQVDTLLSVLVKESTEQICITNLEELLIQKAFLPVHEITLETCQISNNVPSSNLVVSRLVKKGTLPKVSIHTEKRAGNKKVTVVKHLDAYGFELESIATLWKQQFSTFCTVFDPSKEMQKIKNGTKVVMEVHLGGEWLSKLKNVLETDLGFPQHIISVDVQ